MTHWNASEDARGAAELPLKPTGVPIDHYPQDSVELLRDAQRAGAGRIQPMRKFAAYS
jgi:hypothetical protein